MSRSSTSKITRNEDNLAEFKGRHEERSKKKNGLLEDFLGNWQPNILGKIGLEPKVGGVF